MATIVVMMQGLITSRRSGPSRATAVPRKPLSQGPITTSFCIRAEVRRKRGEGCPLNIRLEVRGSVLSSPSGVHAENGFYAYLRSERSRLGHPFQCLRAMAEPTNVAGPGPPPSLPPVDGPADVFSEFSHYIALVIYMAADVTAGRETMQAGSS